MANTDNIENLIFCDQSIMCVYKSNPHSRLFGRSANTDVNPAIPIAAVITLANAVTLPIEARPKSDKPVLNPTNNPFRKQSAALPLP